MKLRRAWEISARPGERMEIGYMEPEDEYPSLVFSRPSGPGHRLVVRAGFLKGDREMKLFASFVDAIVDQVNEQITLHISTQAEARKKNRDN